MGYNLKFTPFWSFILQQIRRQDSKIKKGAQQLPFFKC